MDLLGAMGAGRLLFGLLITGTFANLFYPDVRVTLYENILESKRGLHFPLTFSKLDPYFQRMNNTLLGNVQVCDTLRGKKMNLQPYLSLIDTIAGKFKTLFEIHESVTLLGEHLPRLDFVSYSKGLRYGLDLVDGEAVLKILAENFTKYTDKLIGHVATNKTVNDIKALDDYTNFLDVLNNLDDKLSSYVLKYDAWASDVIGATRSHHLSSSLIEKFVRQNRHTDRTQMVNDYRIEFCGFSTNASEIGCEVIRTSKAGIKHFAKFESFAFNSCAIDFSFLAESISSDKYLYYPNVLTLHRLDSGSACLEAIESNSRSDIIVNCPKRCEFQNLHVGDYGILFNKLTMSDRMQFPKYLTPDVYPPVFLVLNGTREFDDSEGTRYVRMFHSKYSGIIQPSETYFDGELCPKDTDTESWGEYYYHMAPASLTYFGASSGLFSLLYIIRVWLKKKKGRKALRGVRPSVLAMRRPPQDRNQLLALRQRAGQR